jgi:hypothetical protein
VLSHENPRLPAEGAGSSRLRAVFRASKKLYVFDKNNFEYCSVENVLLAWVLS